ncbi:hypothetical protein LXT21_31845 [Myxococcus sp. K38C18041901]|uniref:hypothetical protein n=1 Tax=Myxococcus guangdongensis TaxID=2906760 RepID=UPI0020A73341|nr:hypothetical protein [Myxococcus guangdongensis]MCP3063382.1 hypothetical protein [Myxococcus guangdongensis]
MDMLIPVTHLRVRRRRAEGQVHLILDNYYFDLDEGTDAVWRACDGVRTVVQVAEVLHRERGWDMELALAVTRHTLGAFVQQELVSLVAPPSSNPSAGGENHE